MVAFLPNHQGADAAQTHARDLSRGREGVLDGAATKIGRGATEKPSGGHEEGVPSPVVKRSSPRLQATAPPHPRHATCSCKVVWAKSASGPRSCPGVCAAWPPRSRSGCWATRCRQRASRRSPYHEPELPFDRRQHGRVVCNTSFTVRFPNKFYST